MQYDCIGPSLPSFSGGPYRLVTAMADAACALDDRGALTCQRLDGRPMLSDPGPYTFAEGGQAVLCAIRTDGSAASFQHDGASPLANPSAQPLMPVALPFGPDW
jgi:hypothetical protein